jgi:hypothetical protein
MEGFNELYREFTNPSRVRITLCCLSCKTPLVGYSCPACRADDDREAARANASSLTSSLGSLLVIVMSYVAPIGLGVIGAIVFGSVGAIVGLLFGLGAARVTLSDLRREQLTERAWRAPSAPPEIRLARRYRKHRATYDQAAACYLAWITEHEIQSWSYTDPSGQHHGWSWLAGLNRFLRRYRHYPEARQEMRSALFDAVFAQVCNLIAVHDLAETRLFGPGFFTSTTSSARASRVAAWTKALDASFTGGPDQVRILNALLSEQGVGHGLSMPLACFRWREGRRIAGVIRTHSSRFAEALASRLRSDRSWILPLIGPLLWCGLLFGVMLLGASEMADHGIDNRVFRENTDIAASVVTFWIVSVAAQRWRLRRVLIGAFSEPRRGRIDAGGAEDPPPV